MSVFFYSLHHRLEHFVFTLPKEKMKILIIILFYSNNSLKPKSIHSYLKNIQVIFTHINQLIIRKW